MAFIRKFSLVAGALLVPLCFLAGVARGGAVSERDNSREARVNDDKRRVTVHGYKRRTIYHSPQTPGYTCWAYLWKMPDGDVMLSFTQATGTLTDWRPRAPAEILKRMPKATREMAGYDMTGLTLENVTLRSTDSGKTWRKTGAESFDSCMNGMCGGGIVALADRTVLRDVWGQSVPYWDVPQSGLLQRSTDSGKTWGPPELLSQDPRLQTWPKRLRWLRDGRMLITGAACTYDPDTWLWDAQLPRVRPCLWVSSKPLRTTQGAGKEEAASGISWVGPLYLAAEDVNYAGEEWDAAELENGDLLGILRTATYDPSGNLLSQERRQCLLSKQGQTWKPGPVHRAPFAHSGQPELLETREGVLLHIAANGIWWTADRGANWTKLKVPGTAYYPSAVQLENGVILVVSHVGSDDAYGKVDQSIVLDTFRLTVEAPRCEE
jgi:hypothetical protein